MIIKLDGMHPLRMRPRVLTRPDTYFAERKPHLNRGGGKAGGRKHFERRVRRRPPLGAGSRSLPQLSPLTPCLRVIQPITSVSLCVQRISIILQQHRASMHTTYVLRSNLNRTLNIT